MKTRFFRHGNLLTVTARIEDPIYLTEPYYLTRTFELSVRPPFQTVGQPCIQGDEGVREGEVPHFLPGENPFLNEVTKAYNIPAEAALGGAETMYPEYEIKLAALPEPPLPPGMIPNSKAGIWIDFAGDPHNVKDIQ